MFDLLILVTVFILGMLVGGGVFWAMLVMDMKRYKKIYERRRLGWTR